MQINQAVVLQGPGRARCHQRSGNGMMPTCMRTNIFRNMCICLSPVCVSFIHTELLMKTIAPFHQHRLQSELLLCVLAAGGVSWLISPPGPSSAPWGPLRFNPPFCWQGLDVAQLPPTLGGWCMSCDLEPANQCVHCPDTSPCREGPLPTCLMQECQRQ